MSSFKSRFAVVFAFSCVLSSVWAARELFDYQPFSVWKGVCSTGTQQSPINIHREDAVPRPCLSGVDGCGLDDVEESVFFGTFGTLSKYKVFFTGTALEVEFLEFSVPAEIKIPADSYTIGNSSIVKVGDMLEVEPLQVHFHTFSEHTIDGAYAAGELHIVTRVKEGQSDHCDETESGCLAVFGILTNLHRDGELANEVINNLTQLLPSKTGKEHGITFSETLNLDLLLPTRLDYYAYLGSLTTPPCSEIVSWHVFDEPILISGSIVSQHQGLVAYTYGEDCESSIGGRCFPPREKTNHRDIQPLNGRTVYSIAAGK